jgi:hypothetical protein
MAEKQRQIDVSAIKAAAKYYARHYPINHPDLYLAYFGVSTPKTLANHRVFVIILIT